MIKKGLGRGLEALFEDNNLTDETADNGGRVLMTRITEIEPDKEQPRKQFNDEKLGELASSIKTLGVIQPIIVRQLENGRYSIIAGERRWRAARLAGVSEIPVLVRDFDDREAKEAALIENLQREDLNPVEEANGYKALMDRHELTQEEISSVVGKSRPAVANALRLLNLPVSVLEMLKNGEFSAGHARALLALGSDLAEKTAKRIKKEDLTVRDIEKIAKNKIKPVKGRQLSLTTEIKDLEKRLTESLGRKVRISRGQNKGKIEIDFYGDDDLTVLADILITIEN